MASLWPAGRAELRTGWSFRDLYAPLVGAPVGRDEISSAGYREAWGEAGMLSSRSGLERMRGELSCLLSDLCFGRDAD